MEWKERRRRKCVDKVFPSSISENLKATSLNKSEQVPKALMGCGEMKNNPVVYGTL
jgi:hypothetical protein